MSVRPHPTIVGAFIIDCRPHGYKGKRERVVFHGSREDAIAFEAGFMRRHVEAVDTRIRNCQSIYTEWILWYRLNMSATTGIYQHLAGNYLKSQGQLLQKLVGQCPHGDDEETF